MESALFTTLTVTQEASLSGGGDKKVEKWAKKNNYKFFVDFNIIKNTVSQTNAIADAGDVGKIEQKNTSNITNVIVK